MRVRKAVGAIIEKNGKYLLAHKVLVPKYNIKLDEWDFPRGGIEGDASEEKALMRELKEETGSESYKIIKPLGSFEFEYPEELKAKSYHQMQRNKMFLVEFDGNNNELKPDGVEINKLEWFTEEGVLDMLHFKVSKDFFKEHILGIKKV